MFLTLGDLNKANSSLSRVSGLCPGTDRFTSYVNEATERLMTRGDWATTVIPIQVCIRRGCVTWPRYVGSVRKMNICGSPVPVTNIWSNYLDRDLWPRWYDYPGMNSWGSLGSYFGLGARGSGLKASDSGANKTGYYSTYNDVVADRLIRAYPQFPQDIGKTVTIFGRDENGQPLTTKNTDSDGVVTYTPGVIITIAAPFGSTSVIVQKAGIDRVIKDETEGQVWLYAYNVEDDLLEDLAVYEPSEVNPSYERMTVPGSQSKDEDCLSSVMALIKLKFVKAKHSTDLVTIPSESALKTMIQAILFEEANDGQRASEFEARAIRELNLMLRDLFPEDQTPVAIEPFNATGIGPQQMF